MAHHHSHREHHHHPPVPTSYNRIFIIDVGLDVLFVGVEATFGWILGSLAHWVELR